MKSGLKSGIALALALAITAAVAVRSYTGIQDLVDKDRQVAHSYRVLDNLERVLSVLTSAQASQQDFVLTGQQRYLESYNAAPGQIHSRLEKLKVLNRDEPAQLQSLQQLQELSRQELDELQKAIQVRRQDGLEAALPLIVTDPGQQIMKDVRYVLEQMGAREQQELAAQEQVASQAAHSTVLVVGLGAVLALAVLSAAAVLIIRTMRLTGDGAGQGQAAKTWPGLVIRYAFAVAMVALATASRTWLVNQFGPMPLFITWYPAILLVVSLAGAGPGILATLLSAMAADYWFIEPLGFGIAGLNDKISVGIFVGTGLFLSFLAERLARARRAEALSIAQEQDLALLDKGNLLALDAQFRITRWSEGCRRLYGFEAAQAEGQDVGKVLMTHFAQPAEQVRQIVLEQGNWQGEVTRRRQDGSDLAISLLYALRRGEAGRPPAILEVSTDITTQKQAEETLREQAEKLSQQNEELSQQSEELASQNEQFQQAEEALRHSERRLRTILEALPVAIFLADAQGAIVFTNPAVQSIWGISTHVTRDRYGEYKGRWVASGQPVQPEDWALAVALKTGYWYVNEPVEIDNPARGKRILHNQALPIHGEDGQLLGAVVVTEDVTQRVQAQDQLRLAKEAAEQTAVDLARSNKDLEQFAYVASHDLQEPLRMVSAFVQLLASEYQDKFDDKGKEFIGFAVEGAQRMSQLVRDLLAYSRTTLTGKTLQPVSSENALQAALANLKLPVEETQAKITWNSLPMVQADPVQLTQLFQNLLSNALKFRHADRPVEIQIGHREFDGQCEFSVRDNGIGIDPEHHGKIFQIFQRLHSRDRYPGTGIGLAICKKIVERHGGRIWLESTKGEGTTFRFTLKSE
jgi:PAS domain S-box-containing protein